ncbi:adenylate/guanylate cyclase domain-containing protein [Calothrix sp. PCC 6303]|uniref:adenylate/guanylate cyclase domain-containing protein n=1 Tax=Calothrix sp. PCC 6303 TaxID=1170562 RepID=UPI0005A1CF7F|nr:adenylate/guanylate cyclase domain-containing protein [Calothrix sp. PCC 6303]
MTKTRKFERLVLNSDFLIVEMSDELHLFADSQTELHIGNDARLSFPELMGIEEILISILQGQQDLFELEEIQRSYIDKPDRYLDIYIFCDQAITNQTPDNYLTVLFEDITEKIIVKRKVMQKYHELGLLSSVLSSYKNYMDKVITSMGDALIVTTKSGYIKKINRAAVNLFGYREEELVNQKISLIIDENQLLQQAIQRPGAFQEYLKNVEVVCKNKNREKLLVSFSCSVIIKADQTSEDIIYVGRDITARQRRQQRNCTQFGITRILSESQSLKQAMPEILRIVCESLGWDLGELWTSSEYISIPSESSYVDPILRCVEIWSSRIVSVREFKALTWQTTYSLGMGLPGRVWLMGSPLWVRDIVEDEDVTQNLYDESRSQLAANCNLHAAFGFPILDDNQIFGVMTFFSREVQPPDIDLLQMMVSVGSQIAEFIKRKHAEEALLASEERYRDLFENANDLIISVNPYGRFIYANRAWYETMGYSQADIENINIIDIIHPEYRSSSRQSFTRILSGNGFEQIQTVLMTKNGNQVVLEGNISCRFVDGKPVATRGIFRDITSRIAAEIALRQQQEQTERLLLNILPEVIANQLKQYPGNIAEDYADVSVLFADLVGFTQIASQVSAIQLVKLLNQIFSAFDLLCDRYNLEKIKTIGDAYMVVGGLPMRRQDHADAIAFMALDMQDAIAQFNQENQQNLNIRIGIHSGSVVAGVIGIKKFTYDLWGDTVNIASRMESQGIPGQIQVTEVTYNLLKDKFELQQRGEIEIKGKGKMMTYLLVGVQGK